MHLLPVNFPHKGPLTWCFHWCQPKKSVNIPSSFRWFETLWRQLWCHYNGNKVAPQTHTTHMHRKKREIREGDHFKVYLIDAYMCHIKVMSYLHNICIYAALWNRLARAMSGHENPCAIGEYLRHGYSITYHAFCGVWLVIYAPGSCILHMIYRINVQWSERVTKGCVLIAKNALG